MADTSAHGDDLHVAPKSAEDLEHHPGPRAYVMVAIVLAIITAAEVAIYYVPSLASFLVAFLIVFSAIKFFLVVMWFMHLRFDDRRYARFFVTGLAGAATLYLIVLISLRVFV